MKKGRILCCGFFYNCSFPVVLLTEAFGLKQDARITWSLEGMRDCIFSFWVQSQLKIFISVSMYPSKQD